MKLLDSDPDGGPLRLSADERRPSYALRTSDGSLLAQSADDGETTVKLDEAFFIRNYGEALRWRRVYARQFDGPLAIVEILVTHRGRPYGVRTIEDAPPPEGWGDLNSCTAAMAQAAAFESDAVGFDSWIGHAYRVAHSPLWTLLKAAHERERQADAKDAHDPDTTQDAEVLRSNVDYPYITPYNR